MTIVPKTLVNIPELQKDWPTFKSVNNCDREKIRPEMRVLIRSNGENILVKVEEIDGDYITGKVLTKTLYQVQPFGYLDFILFEKRNVFDIIVVEGELY